MLGIIEIDEFDNKGKERLENTLKVINPTNIVIDESRDLYLKNLRNLKGFLTHTLPEIKVVDKEIGESIESFLRTISYPLVVLNEYTKSNPESLIYFTNNLQKQNLLSTTIDHVCVSLVEDNFYDLEVFLELSKGVDASNTLGEYGEFSRFYQKDKEFNNHFFNFNVERIIREIHDDLENTIYLPKTMYFQKSDLEVRLGDFKPSFISLPDIDTFS